MKNSIKNDAADKKEIIQPETNNKKAEFEALINGEYKDLFSEKIKEIISKRLKGTEDVKEKLSKYEDFVKAIATKYGADPEDFDAIMEKASGSVPQKEVPVNTEKGDNGYIENLEKENKYFKQMLEQERKNKHIEQQLKDWYNQCEEIAKEYPDFNLEGEIENEKFISLLKNGIDMKTAYQVAHLNDIMGGNRFFENQEKERMMSVAGRPVENGLSSQSPAILKTDVSKLTPEQRALIAKRVAMGETITF